MSLGYNADDSSAVKIDYFFLIGKSCALCLSLTTSRPSVDAIVI